MTPSTETHVIAEATERFGLRYFSARKTGKLR